MAASALVAAVGMTGAAPSAGARTSGCADARAGNSPGVPAPTGNRVTGPGSRPATRIQGPQGGAGRAPPHPAAGEPEVIEAAARWPAAAPPARASIGRVRYHWSDPHELDGRG